MPRRQAHPQDSGQQEPTFRQVVMGDLRQTDFPGSFRQDLRDLYRFYLSEERRAELARMGTVRGIFWFWGWLFKSLMMKLSPPRRLTLLAAVILVVMGEWQLRFGEMELVVHLRMVGVLLVFVVLMLELKDKLLARDEIEVARQVQLALLPRRNPEWPGWAIWSHTQPANDVGGDLIDFVELDGTRLGVALGDVAGKGLGAALLMAKLQATVRAVAPGCPSLAELGQRLNAILLRDGIHNRYATMFYVELEPDTGRLRFLNAGHNPPLVIGPAGVQELRAPSLPLGMMSDARYVQEDRILAPGELLIIYSDGVTEAANVDDQEFGAGRLRDIAASLRGSAPEEAGTRLLDHVRAFLGEARPGDDLSLVILARLRDEPATQPS
ncbi:MAG TPA: PP2C family protein-serine/threonine phosphatase [Candidatus Polarisedimenticolia bacterium]|nr:PP2C family protein-serine/threonine phosphatase [Candidatus Polarisedimenticolia bacterium]